MAEPDNVQEQGEKPRVLVVDDSKMVRVTAQKFLGKSFDLILAEDGEEAWLKIGADESIQVVFTDLGMPNLDGFGLIERVRQSEVDRIRNLPLIVITGASEEEDIRRKVFEVGATDFITKPFKATEIIARAEAHASYRKDKDTLQKNVDIDILTGALNVEGVQEQLEKDVSFINRHAENLALITFELDAFDQIYKRLGKQNSEALIKQTAKTLLAAVRKEDSVGRLGTCKFAVILPMAKTEGVILLAKRLCQKINDLKITVAGEAFSVSMSAGVSAVRKGSRATAKNLLKLSDQALGNAKKVGSGEVQILKLEEAANEEELLTISIDNLLQSISQGDLELSENQVDNIIDRLKPLVNLMSHEKKQQLLE